MSHNKPLILITNDDGLIAKGISELVKFVRPLGEIVVVAPDAPRSGSGCSLTVTQPVHFKMIRKDVGLTVYRCSGSPVDCVKLARHAILDRDPDLVLSGINHGDNSGVNVHYSGTMGAVIEACVNRIPAIGFSLCDHDQGADFEPMGKYVRELTKMVLLNGLPDYTCLNVNFPKVEEIKGLKVCQQARGSWSNEWEPCPRSFDENYYWMSGSFVPLKKGHEKSDNWALANGYGAITPTLVDMTDYKFAKELDSLVAGLLMEDEE
ncbi:Multifunctional protein surE [Bacteroides coprosuis DSM 18011]|uniref:5'-nucleotidase SurE n=1 Tax=Bacteroides coprosuis DSM 18011 TaxID=679937 RepID=F3ZSP3_9BACE|nr:MULTISPECIES: 5'/3'-nucleotidase SurE [Bacteroides]EGJ70917.1 Multifunctional protein surE [Bacteroides coprosuis DSM 18011]HJD91098.1 5'/3'-nucleotidase SurE [Bacteroides coprosuis]